MSGYDAFSEGVGDGGLRSRDEIKALICYILRNLDSPLTNDQLNEIILGKSLANYFDVSQSLSELVANGSVTSAYRDGRECLMLSGEAYLASDVLERELPLSIRERAIDAGVAILTRARRERETNINIEPSGRGFTVTFTIADGGDILMRLSVYAADKQQAERVKNNFLSDPVRIYSGIIAALKA
ncbi:MAG: DUF4364 family protein [Clostridiales bacterium]|jgi:hypothetical protein|nr:DUF4364 family protein [Clostridiales bacterium]